MANEKKGPVSRIASGFQFFGSIVATIVVVVAAFEYFSGVAIFSNLSKSFEARYGGEVLPAMTLAQQYQSEHGIALKSNNSLQFHADLVKKFLEEKSALPTIVVATEILDDMVKCHESMLCRVENFFTYEQRIRRFWFTFQPAIIDLRASELVPADFGAALQAKAIEILEAERAENRLPPAG
ncbi:hypothetical protein [Aquibium microcysteis]|uniref:hypothetical protein n=1 Tax=Aquibium microcysteis TaxID=675281 RepID=UPI00165D08E0|nr:hypothetical protein [Aquibium microcysteis]